MSNFGGVDEAKLHQNLAGSDKLTLDFLGVGGVVRNISGGFSHRDQQQHQQQLGMNMSSLEQEAAKSNSQQPTQAFGRTKLH